MVSYWLIRSSGTPAEGPFSLDQLRRMYDTGNLTTLALVCRCGEESWQALGDELQVMEAGHLEAFRCKRRVKTGGDGCVALILFIVAIVVLLFFWPLGLLLMVFAVMSDRRYGWLSFCGACGNTVASTSLQCPTCGARLVVLSRAQKLKRLLRELGWWLVAGLIFVVGVTVLWKILISTQGQ